MTASYWPGGRGRLPAIYRVPATGLLVRASYWPNCLEAGYRLNIEASYWLSEDARLPGKGPATGRLKRPGYQAKDQLLVKLKKPGYQAMDQLLVNQSGSEGSRLPTLLTIGGARAFIVLVM